MQNLINACQVDKNKESSAPLDVAKMNSKDASLSTKLLLTSNKAGKLNVN